MSWRIYTGFKLQSVTSVSHLESFLNDLRRDITAATRVEMAEHILTSATGVYDAYTSFGLIPYKTPITPLHDATVDWMRTYMSGGTLADYNELSISYCAFEGTVYGVDYLLTVPTKKIFYGHPQVIKYDWFDSTDKPDDVPNSEWKERKRVWTAIFADTPSPALRMSNAVLVQRSQCIPEDKEMEKSMLTMEAREEACAAAMASARSHIRLVEDFGENGPERPDHVIKYNQEEYRKALIEVKGKLTSSVTMENLSTPIK